MATLKQQYDASQDPVLVSRVRMATLNVVAEVLKESDTTPNHDMRVRLARSILNNPQSFEQRITAAIIIDHNTLVAQFDTTVSPPKAKEDQAADTALLTRLRAVWNDLAGT